MGIKSGEARNGVLSTEEEASALIFENPGRIWALNEAAKKLNISRRTLIGKLESEGTKFQTVRDEQSKKQVVSYIGDVSSFRRRFKRWFGETPSQFMTKVRRHSG